MTTFQKVHTPVAGRRVGKDVFTSQTCAAHPVAGLQIAAVFMAGLLAVVIMAAMTMHPAQTSAAADIGTPAFAQGLAETKTDRVSPSLPTKCEGQAWGAWSADCAAALSGTDSLRHVSFITVEEPSSISNETILARYQAAQ
ncbi:MAG: phosphopantetheine adenylyltransferase [Roseibium sp.]|nr:phosphopantetheine adenylyltransferase [Roseibium sp.]